jgi:Protein of unknown function (DUF2934)
MGGTHVKRLRQERLAYWLWQQRGMPMGSPEEDWLLAEALFKGTCRPSELPQHEMPLFAFAIERRTR